MADQVSSGATARNRTLGLAETARGSWRRMLLACEESLARALMAVLSGLGPVAASNLAGRLARLIGPLLPVSRVADRNLRAALPDLDAMARRRIVHGVWENLGRTVGEFPHVGSLPKNPRAGPGWDVVNDQVLVDIARRGGPAIFFSGHIGNWELLPFAVATYGAAFASIFRAASNPGVDALIMETRRRAIGQPVPMFPKGLPGARAARAHLAAGGYLGMLVDQKMNDGIEARLFGLPAMTAPALAAFALRFRCPVVPGHVARLGPARLRLVVEDPLPLPDTGDRHADIRTFTQTVNDVLERWIRERPESWLWLHRRFPKGLT